MSSEYYVYVYLDTRTTGLFQYGSMVFEHEPFYVGKGKDGRYREHMNEGNMTTNRGRNPFKQAVIRKVIKETKQHPKVVFIKESLSPKDAIMWEQQIIETIGRRDTKMGPLTNLTGGGIGMLGYKQSKQQRNNIAKALRGKKKTEQHKQALRIGNVTKRCSWLVTDPNGRESKVDALGDFCQVTGLIYREMLKISHRTEENKHIHRAIRHRGWMCKKIVK